MCQDQPWAIRNQVLSPVPDPPAEVIDGLIADLERKR